MNTDKKTIKIGERGNLNIEVLLKTRLLIQANSGGGKSWLLRRLVEQLFGLVPIIIIDPEGEFATLREKFGYVLVGKGGETPADARSAKLVAHKLLELRASAVCDIYEMNPSARHHWVRLFVEALVDAPKELWRPTFIVVDEAHTFCPEKGQGESEALEAMTALATRGRKRRFCAIWATQRLAKLNKSATAELLNRLIGPTFEDVDLKRAADLLSIAKENRREFEKEMRVLEPGTFYALGRAISTERVLVKVGDVQTSHEVEDANPGLGPPPTPDKIKGLLPKLADLPKEAEEKLRTESELRAEIRGLKQELAHAKVAAPKVEQKEVPVFTKDDLKLFDTVLKSISDLRAEQRSFDSANCDLSRMLLDLPKRFGAAPIVWPATPVQRPAPPIKVAAVTSNVGNGSEVKGGLRRILIGIANRPGITKVQLAVRAGFTLTGGTFGTYISTGRKNGWIIGDEKLEISEEGKVALGPYEPLPEGQELLNHWLKELGDTGAAKMLRVIANAYPNAVTKADLAAAVQMTESGGSFGTYLSKLRTLELVEGKNEIKASAEFFE